LGIPLGKDPYVQPKHLDVACVNPRLRGFSGTRRGHSGRAASTRSFRHDARLRDAGGRGRHAHDADGPEWHGHDGHKHIDGRLAFLKTELKITDAQLPLWNALAQAMRANATAMQAMPDAMMGMSKAATLPDKLTERETMLTARIEAVRKLKGAVDPLYAALDADQKKTADEIMLSPMGMMM